MLGELEELGGRHDLRLRRPQDPIQARCPTRWEGVAEGSPARVLAGCHPAQLRSGFLVEWMMLNGKVADPGSRLGELDVAFGVAGGCGFGGA